MKKIIIAIDGYSSTGKSTLAKQLAKKLNYIYIDSGAMYRAITLYFLQNSTDRNQVDCIRQALSQIRLNFVHQQIHLNGVNVEEIIRSMEVSNLVSEVAALEQVRVFAVQQQQFLGKERGIVMDGRDIGTTVFPDAELKIFLTAQEDIRSQRRFDEMKLKSETITLLEVKTNLAHRDHIDSTREFSPLTKAIDAVVLDNSHLSMDEQLEIAYGWAMEKVKG